MATKPLAKNPAPPESVELQFRRLEAEWRAGTAHLSSTTKIVNHPAFEAIIQLGEPVVPLMLKDLSERPRLWVWALPAITGADPTAPADAGDIAAMSAAWLRWGRERGYQ